VLLTCGTIPHTLVGMNIDRPAFTPSTVEKLTDIASVIQRDWRTRKLIGDYGQQESNRQWKYSFQDAVGLWVMSRLASFGIGLNIASGNGKAMAVEVISILQGKEPAYRFVAFTLPEIYRGQFKTFGGIERFAEERGAERIEVIDLKRLAESAPVGIREIAADIESW
jgi:hypothetical protein